jgi:hypothetical protein
MSRSLTLTLLSVTLALSLAGTQAQTVPALRLIAGAPIAGGVSSGGGMVVIGSLAPFGAGRAVGGQFSLVGGVAPGPAPDAQLFLPHIAR